MGALAPLLTRPAALGLSSPEIGLAASSYLAGAVLGSLIFGHLADRYGRKRLFMVTLALYIVATAASGCAVGFLSLACARFVTGAGIGGEYSAINSAIQELIPANRRGRVDIVINGSFWLGAAAAAALSTVVLHLPGLAAPWAWRLAFGCGALLGLAALAWRRRIPESPRWLAARGLTAEAEAVMAVIEDAVQTGLAPAPSRPTSSPPPPVIGVRATARILFHHYRQRAILAVILMLAQAFLYNAFFFTDGLVLSRFDHVPAGAIGLYLLPFTLSNFLGAVLLARLFDTVGRRPMMIGTYALAGLLMLGAAWLFRIHALSAGPQTAAWATIFFFASAGASGAYLTVSEAFPLAIRARAIAVFYALGTAFGGIMAPALLARLIASGSRHDVFGGYALAAGLMLAGAFAAARYGFAAEGKPLEEIAGRLSGPSSRPTTR